MSEVCVENREIVVPGDVLARGMDYLPGFGTYRRDEDIIASRLGLVRVEGRALKITPLSGRYLPKKNDVVIGRIIDITVSGWRVDINSAYSGMLMVKEASSDYIQKGADLTQYHKLDEYIVCRITNVTSQKLVDLTLKGPGLKKLTSGRIIMVNPYKVPRVIGKGGSMVAMIKEATDCNIIVGQNGIIWLKGTPKEETIAIRSIRKVEKEAHYEGLTYSIKDMLEEETGKEVQIKNAQQEGE